MPREGRDIAALEALVEGLSAEREGLEQELRNLKLELAEQLVEAVSLRNAQGAEDSADGELERELMDATAELTRLRLRTEELEDQGNFNRRRLKVLEHERERHHLEMDATRAQVENLGRE